jgi:hypothetical protein
VDKSSKVQEEEVNQKVVANVLEGLLDIFKSFKVFMVEHNQTTMTFGQVVARLGWWFLS